KPLLEEENANYTKSAHFSKYTELDLTERIRKQGEFHEIMKNGLNIEEISLKEVRKKYQNLSEVIRIVCGISDIACLRFTT
ncbi:unnamed protein product, partial [marine sediment metagenome]